MNRPRVPCGTRGLCRSDARVRALEVCYQRLSATDAVGGGTHDAAGISGTLAARVKARGRHGVACSIADDRNRGARTRLHASEDRIGAVIATQFLTEQGNSQTKRFDDMLREGIVDRPSRSRQVDRLVLPFRVPCWRAPQGNLRRAVPARSS